MIVMKLYIPISVLVVLCALTRIRSLKAQYHGGYEMANHYGGGYTGGGYGVYGGDAQSSEEVDERPKVRLGIRLKIPAMKFELPRVNLPKITVSAKIRQPDGPRVISLPEINLDTSSKVEPPGAHQSSSHMLRNAYYGTKQPHYANETQGDDSPRQNRYNTIDHGNQYRGSYQDYSSTVSLPTYWTQRQYGHHNNKVTDNSHHNTISDTDIGFNSPVWVEPGTQYKQQYSVNNGPKPINYQSDGLRNLHVESGGRFKRNHGVARGLGKQ